MPERRPAVSPGTVTVTVYSFVCILAAWSTERMVPVKVLPRADTDTSTGSPMESLGTRVSDTMTVTFICVGSSMTATGALVLVKLFSVTFRLASTPLMGATTLPLPSTCSKAVFSCSRLDW